MKTNVRQETNSTVIDVNGSVDALTAPELSKTLLDQIADGHANLVVNLIGVEFMSSAGLRTLLGAVKEARSKGGDLRIASATPGVDKVLRMSGFHNIAKVFSSQDEAVSSFGS
ncbi:MAG TPA: STAS domain-containing protein [Anaerolineales bacterium]|nr:STAS domain-containing protein [Anaerolineales bacterium]